MEWIGWVFVVLGAAAIISEVVMGIIERWRKVAALKAVKTILAQNRDEQRLGAQEKALADLKDVLTELVKKLPWTVIVGFILLYLGLFIIGAPLPFSVNIGS
jgi:uncharacterized membrane protein YcjF (UPF0283 family)